MEIIIKNLELADKKSSSLIELLEKYQVEYSVQPNGSKPDVSGSLPLTDFEDVQSILNKQFYNIRIGAEHTLFLNKIFEVRRRQ